MPSKNAAASKRVRVWLPATSKYSLRSTRISAPAPAASSLRRARTSISKLGRWRVFRYDPPANSVRRLKYASNRPPASGLNERSPE